MSALAPVILHAKPVVIRELAMGVNLAFGSSFVTLQAVNPP